MRVWIDRWLWRVLVLGTIMLAATALYPHAQGGVPGTITQESPTSLRAPVFTTTATGAANTAVTVTAPGQSGLYFYLCSVYIATANNAAVTAAAGPAPVFTTTNLPTNLVWWGNNGIATTGLLQVVTDAQMPVCLKTAAPGTPFTIVTSGGQSTQSARLNISGYYAP